jgi:xylan 1,4-beta-xylosidase
MSTMSDIVNPVYAGFYPDPSICRVGEDYYIANSTFEWFPGVPVHHSKDLVHWRLIGHILTRRSQLDLRGVPDSGGVWAPSLSYADGQFWLTYANMHNTALGRPFKDIRIYLMTSKDILGPWSEPIELNSIGFDPSLFHDDDGRKWLVNMIWDFRKGRSRFGGVVVQEYDHEERKLIGSMTNVLAKPILTEGPNIYKRDSWYYLMMAEGGTSWNHGISMARSRKITGPYEQDPQQSVLTSRDDGSLTLQKAGHGEIVQTPAGEWYLAHLASRPITPDRRCVLGRETCLQKVEWREDWLRLAKGGCHPMDRWPMPAGMREHPWPAEPVRDDFDAKGVATGGMGELDITWSTLRAPAEESWISLTQRPGWLRLRGRESLHSPIEPSVVAKRQTVFRCVAETRMQFEPTHYTQMAGLVYFYNRRMHYYLRVTHDEKLGKVIGVVLTDNDVYDELGDIAIAGWKDIYLRAEIDQERLQFSASPDGRTWQNVGSVLDASKVSDDYGVGFTGAMIGLSAQDLGGTKAFADFDHFELRDVNP